MRCVPMKRVIGSLAVGIAVGCAMGMAESQLGMDSESFWLNMEADDSPVSVLGNDDVTLEGVSDMNDLDSFEEEEGQEMFDGTGELDNFGVSDVAGDWDDATMNLEEEDGPNGVDDDVELLESSASVELQQLLNSIFRCRTMRIALEAENGELLSRCSECKEPALQSSTVLNGSALSFSSIWGMLRRGLDTVALRSDDGRYLDRCNGCAPGASEDAAFASARIPVGSSVWKIIPRPDGKLALQGANGKFLARCDNCAPGAGSDQVYVHVSDATDTTAQWKAVCVTPEQLYAAQRAHTRRQQQIAREKALEQMKMVKLFSEHPGAKTIFQCRVRTIALVSDDGEYLSRCNDCAQSSLQSSIVGNGSASNPESVWTVLRRGLDTVALQADNQQFLSQCSGCIPGAKFQEAAFANGRAPTGSAVWKMVLRPDGKIALQSDNGKYLARCSDCAPGVEEDPVFVYVSDPSNPQANWKPECLSFTQLRAIDQVRRERERQLQREKELERMRVLKRWNEQSRELHTSSQLNRRVVASFFQCRSRRVALQADNGEYLSRPTESTDGEGRSPAVLNSTLSASSMWELGQLSSVSFSLRSTTGRYLSLCNKCIPGAQVQDAAVVNTPSTSAFKKWFLYAHASGNFSFLSVNGQYLARCSDCVPGASNDQAFVHASSASDPAAQWKVVCLSYGQIHDLQRTEARQTQMQRPQSQSSMTPRVPNPFIRCRARSVRLYANTGKVLSRCAHCGKTRYPDSATLISLPHIHHMDSKWHAHLLPNNRVALRSPNGKFLAWCWRCVLDYSRLSAMPYVNSPHQANAQWEWSVLPNGQVTFRAENGQYLGYSLMAKRGRFQYASVERPFRTIRDTQWTVKCF